MAEIPAGYFPDLTVGWNLKYIAAHLTEINRARNGREQRRGFAPAAGIRHFAASSDALVQSDRRSVYDFLQLQRGRLGAFYFWNPPSRIVTDVSVGSVTAFDRIIIPYRTTNPSGGVPGSLSDVRVASVTKAFTNTPLLPRAGTSNGLFFNPAFTQYIDTGSSSLFRATGDVTLATWINNTRLVGSVKRAIMGNEVANASGTSFWMTAAQTLQFITNQAGANTTATSSGTVPIKTWTHVVAVRSGTNVTFYINGVAAGTVAGISNPVVSTNTFRLGDVGSGTFGWDGLIQDARYYDVALSAGQVANLYNGVPVPSANLRGWWLFTDGTGAAVADSSGNALPGNFIGALSWISGEEMVVFTGGNQTGAVTVTGLLRERLVARFDSDAISQGFLQDAADVRAIFDVSIQELV